MFCSQNKTNISKYTTTSKPFNSSTAALKTIKKTHDETNLQNLFDDPTLVQFPVTPSGPPTGLFLEPRFKSPEAFHQSSIIAINQAQELVNIIINSHNKQDLKLVVKRFDQLSDILCQVMDVAELVRQAHPSPEWQMAAEQVYSGMLEYMNGLNTHVGLYNKLVYDVMENPEISGGFTEIEYYVAMSFKRDFEKSGIHLDKRSHEKFIELSSDINDLSRDFLRPYNGDEDPGVGRQRRTTRKSKSDKVIRIRKSQLNGLMPSVERAIVYNFSRVIRDSDTIATTTNNNDNSCSITNSLKNSDLMLEVTVNEYVAHHILRDCKDENIREQVYKISRGGGENRVYALEKMLEKRKELAKLVGFDSFASMALHDKMARSPEHVEGFLRYLAKNTRPKWNKLVSALRNEKIEFFKRTCQSPANADNRDGGSAVPLWSWDQDFLMSRSMQSQAALPSLSPFFSLGRVVVGLSKLFQCLYGIRFRPAVPRPGELWHPEVRKLEAVDEDDRLVGIIYCDVFARDGKMAVGAAHFTARCARRVDDDTRLQASEQGLANVGIENGNNNGVLQSETVVYHSDGRAYQLPLVVLMCDFSPPTNTQPSLLSLNELETLFHEMGHAMHSMLGQNGYHNVAGTRCPVDFVELPSILMEHFARSPEVLSLFASHYTTDKPLPYALVEQHVALRSYHEAMDSHAQLLMSMLDQQYHSAYIGDTGRDINRNGGEHMFSLAPDWSTRMLAKLQTDTDFGSGDPRVFPPVPGTRWQARFGHLVGYGASYYSYLFDRALAAKIWASVFNSSDKASGRGGEGPLSRESGERFKNQILWWGGGRDPWHSLAAFLDTPTAGLGSKRIESLSRGDRTAIQMVGSWGIS
ncbi:Mitochondrial intermediate peptidase [Mycoemilia scoparia]|uniref:mitochondrial intermediate peptidase n=1 Tax=Mycoemilia scoparia TaxID=417184 RepID=A0A9W8DPT7_9FUNG|nr:Mitochondrial intermediate peptidase [Mycoemilia scoparia]